MTEFLEDALKIYKEVNGHLADLEDFGDRFNYIGCVTVLLVCTLVVSTKQYFLKPISCFIATEVGGSNLLNYVETFCWIQGTVPIAYAGQIPSKEDEWNEMEKKKILYYQWVPFVLGLQSVLFCLPRLMWKTFYSHTGTNGNTLINVVLRSVDALHAPIRERQVIIDEIADSTEYYFNKRFFSSVGSKMSRVRCLYKADIITSYLFVKVLYLINTIGQLILMKQFLGLDSFTDFGYGLNVLSDVLKGHDWQVTQVFPRVGFCYVKIKCLGVSTNAVTAQCVLPLNMLNEKIFIFLWWWISAAAIITIFYLIVWAFRIGSKNRETNYILKYIRMSSNEYRECDRREVENFVTKYLGREGTFLFRMIRLNAGEQVAATVVKAFWERYRLFVAGSTRRGFPESNIPMSPESIFSPRNIYPQSKSFFKESSKTESDLMDESIVTSQAYV